MTNELAQRGPQTLAAQVWGDRLQVVKDQIAKGLTDAELEVFAAVAERSKLDVFARPPQIYPVKRWDSRLGREVLVIQGAVDGFRLIAARTREFGGEVGPQWCGDDGVWRDVWLSDEPPTAARVGVLRKGFREPTWGVALWKESAQWFKNKDGQRYLGEFWQRMPAHMLAKTAEVDALKKAFPNDTRGIELEKIEGELEAERGRLAERYVEIYGAEDYPPSPVAIARNAAGDTIDTATGELLEAEPVLQKPDRAQLWAENRRLVAEARKRGIAGSSHSAAEPDTLEDVNRVLAERIENYDLDQIAKRESER